MKYLLVTICALLVITGACLAEENPAPFTITAKQGFVMTWEDQTIKNLTTFETIKTKKMDSWGKWNALWEGWSVDAGFAYDANSLNVGALLIGREFGMLGNYLPISFPLKDAITITLYPVGIYVNDLVSHPKVKGCSGGAIIKATIKFG